MSTTKQSSKFEVLKFAVIICLICSLVVSTSAILLRGIQEKNAHNEKRINILRAAGLVEQQSLSDKEINEKFQQILSVVVNLQSGELDKTKNPYSYDMYAAANNPKEGHALSDDPASIKRQAYVGSAYIVVDGDTVKRIILPIQGYGLWSTMYGFTAISLDNPITISGITFYQHSETPGLGAEITNPVWQKKWQGTMPYDKQYIPHIRVTKTANPERKNEVDSISGATLTSRGVEHLMNFWLGDSGYKKFIMNIVSGKITVNDMRSLSAKNREI